MGVLGRALRSYEGQRRAAIFGVGVGEMSQRWRHLSQAITILAPIY